MPRTDLQPPPVGNVGLGAGEASTLRVERQPSAQLWDQFLASRQEGTLYHQRAWDRPLAVYNLPTYRIAALRAGRVVGVLALARQSSWLFGNRLVSLPWFDSAGVLADEVAVCDALRSEAQCLAAELRVDSVHLRQSSPIESWPAARTDKVLMRLNLDADPDRMWTGLEAKVRNQIRKAEKEGLSYQRGGPELLEPFHAVYAANMRDLGSPAHSIRFFEEVAAAFPPASRFHVTWFQRRAVGAGLTLDNGSALEIPWASSLRRFNSYCVNHLLYWNLIRDACLGGYTYFHFGRSSEDSGTYRFKKQWGAKATALHWYTFRSDGSAALAVDKPEESFSLARRVWRWLPLWAAGRLSSRIIRNVA